MSQKDAVASTQASPVLNGRVGIVTGAGRGLGREHALMLATEGASVVVNDLGASPDGEYSSVEPVQEVVNEIRRRGGGAIMNQSDVSTSKGADELIATAVKEFGRLDILVNNAGILRD